MTIGKLKPETIQAIVDEMVKKGMEKEPEKGKKQGQQMPSTESVCFFQSSILTKSSISCDVFSRSFIGDAEWDATSKKRRAIIYWRKPEDWAAMISSWVKRSKNRK